jgi:thioredoxin reductase (NADPH)
MTGSNGNARVWLIGMAQSQEAFALRDFLQRSVVAFDWIDLLDDDQCQCELGRPLLGGERLPVVELPDGTRLEAPSVHELADHLG